ncbi:helix-turn-helix domain-containing protein [Rhodococcus pyridinivorans]|uniref:helix-turn-helix domain-containing protein n=1 Tax=Rhodococcus pyridinivorans TaxID=103816 RepID=UPI003464D510
MARKSGSYRSPDHEEERIQSADLCRDGVSAAKTAKQWNRAPSTIYRELKRNASTSGMYRL